MKRILENPLLMPLYLPALLTSIANALLLPILPLFILEFNVSYGMVGLVLACEPLGTVLGDLPGGILLRRFGNKWVMLIGLIITGITTGLIFIAPSIALIILLRLISGGGKALYQIAQHEYITNTISTEKRGQAIALYGGVFRFGNFLGPSIGGFVAAAYGLRSPFLIVAFIFGMALLVILIFREKIQFHSAQKEVISTSKVTMMQVFKAYFPIFASAGIGQLFVQIIRVGTRVIIPVYAADQLGLNTQNIGLILSISASIDLLLFYPAGWVMDHFGRKYAIIPSFLIQASGMALIPFTDSFVSLLMAATIIAFGNGLSSGTMMTLGSDLAPRHARSEFLGMWRLIGDVGFAAGPIMVGGITDMLVLSAAAWTLSGAGLAAALVFILFVRETLEKPAIAQQTANAPT